MNTPIKDNEYIQANEKAFIEAFERARASLGKLEGVTGVGLGHKETGGEFASDIAIHVFVREKKPQDELAPAQRIPAFFEGYRTDVRVVQKAELAVCNNQQSYATIQGGMQITGVPSKLPVEVSLGTLGCIVKKRGNTSAENVYVLTCAHVFSGNDAKVKDMVYHPLPPRKTAVTKRLGPITSMPAQRNKDVWVHGMTGWHPLHIDCAIARITLNKECCCCDCGPRDIAFDTTIIDLKRTTAVTNPPNYSTADENRIVDVRDLLLESIQPLLASGLRVRKVGRTTGATEGIVRGVLSQTSVQKSEGGPDELLTGLIEIEYAQTIGEMYPVNCEGKMAFANRGDSGSLVLDMSRKAVGMVVASQKHLPQAIGWRAYACHIVPILDELEVYIPTFQKAGTGHGADAATDGSGAERYVKGVQLDEDEDKELFASLGLANKNAPALPRDAPPSPDSEQWQRVSELRENLRQTVNGAELLDAFEDVQREIGYLVRNSRPVKVAWHRHRGPAFLAQLVSCARGDCHRMPRAIGEATRATLLARMRAALLAQGSYLLQEAIERHGDTVMQLAEAETVQEFVDILRRLDTTESIA